MAAMTLKLDMIVVHNPRMTSDQLVPKKDLQHHIRHTSIPSHDLNNQL